MILRVAAAMSPGSGDLACEVLTGAADQAASKIEMPRQPESCRATTHARPSSKRRVDGVEVDATTQPEHHVKF